MNNTPAFPTGAGITPYFQGMTLRDYFAARAMQTMTYRGDANVTMVSIQAYALADAMLKAREA